MDRAAGGSPGKWVFSCAPAGLARLLLFVPRVPLRSTLGYNPAAASRLLVPAIECRRFGKEPQKNRIRYVNRTPRPISGARSLMNEEWLR